MSPTPGLRISGGEHRGRRIPLPRHHELRPTSERARQAFFDVIGPDIRDATFLDLFAGTGVFAIEALSRGASRAVAVELARRAADHMKETAEKIGVPLTVIHGDIYRIASTVAAEGPFDIVYADPPYGDDRWNDLLTLIGAGILAPRGVLALEHWTTVSESVPERGGGLRRTRTARYGTVGISFYEFDGEA